MAASWWKLTSPRLGVDHAFKYFTSINSRLHFFFYYNHHHIVSATALIHRTARPSIAAKSSLFGLSPKCRQFVIMWPRSHVAAPHTHRFRSLGSPTDVVLPGWRPVPSALGWPSAMYATAECDHSGVVLLDGCHISATEFLSIQNSSHRLNSLLPQQHNPGYQL